MRGVNMLNDFLYILFFSHMIVVPISLLILVFSYITEFEVTIDNTWAPVLGAQLIFGSFAGMFLPSFLIEGTVDNTIGLTLSLIVSFIVHTVLSVLMLLRYKDNHQTIEKATEMSLSKTFNKRKYRAQSSIDAVDSFGALEDYDAIQDVMNYLILEMNDFTHNKFIADVFCGYYLSGRELEYDRDYLDLVMRVDSNRWFELENKARREPQKIYYKDKNKLKKAYYSKIKVENDDGISPVATQYKVSFAVIQSIIGKDLQEDVIEDTLKIIETYNKHLETEVKQKQELERKVKDKEHERIKELLAEELRWINNE